MARGVGDKARAEPRQAFSESLVVCHVSLWPLRLFLSSAYLVRQGWNNCSKLPTCALLQRGDDNDGDENSSQLNALRCYPEPACLSVYDTQLARPPCLEQTLR